MIASTTAVEVYAEWVSNFNYPLNARVVFQGRIYECVRFDSVPTYPPVSDPIYWLDRGVGNILAMFDDLISTATTAPTSLVVVLDTGIINSLGLFNLTGDTLVLTATNGIGGDIVYSRTIVLDGTIISDWYQYFFEPSVQLGEIILTDIPPYTNLRLTLTITGQSTGIGQIAIGTFYDLGGTQYGASVGIVDYSTVVTDNQGYTVFTPGQFSKRANVTLMLPNAQLNKVQRILADIRGKPCAWVGVEDRTYAPLYLFGAYRDFSITIDYPTESLCSMEIIGVT